MRKNVASQNVAGMMVSATTGAPLTTGVAVLVTGDNGTQTAGGGTATHKGNGQWNYAPTQAETNFNHIAFVFTHASGVNQTVNVYTVSFDPHDTVRQGLTALPNAAAGGAGGVPVVGTGANNFKSDASANVTFANTSIATATNVTTVNGLAANVITAASIATSAPPKIVGAVTGTAEAGSSTSQIFDTANRTETTANYWQHSVVRMTSGVNSGQARRITSYSTGIITVSPNFKSTVGIGDTYVILGTACNDGLKPVTEGNVNVGVDGSQRVAADLFASQANSINVNTLATGTISAAKFAANAVDSTVFAQNAADRVWSSATRTLSALTSGVALEVWNVLESAIVTASSIGLKVKNNLDAAITTRLAPTVAGRTLLVGTDNFAGADVRKIDSETQAAINLTDMFDGATGYYDGIAPATQRQLAELAALAASIKVVAGSFVLTTGSVISGTVASTRTPDAIDHLIQVDVSGNIDFEYEFNVTAAGTTSLVTMQGGFDGGLSQFWEVFAWNWNTTAWEAIGYILGQTQNTPRLSKSYPLRPDHAGTGGDAGRVRIRFTTNTAPGGSRARIDYINVGYIVQPDNAGILARLPAALSGGLMASDMQAVSTDTVAADNLEAMFDGAGYADPFAPSTQQQVDNLAGSVSAINVGAVAFSLPVGSQVGTFANTLGEDGITHDLSDAAGTLDAQYDFQVTPIGVPVQLKMVLRLAGVGDTVVVQARDFGGAVWDQIGVINGKSTTALDTVIATLFARHVGSGADLGVVRIRFTGTGLTTATLFVDQLVVSYVTSDTTIIRSGLAQGGGATFIDLDAGASAVNDFYKPSLVLLKTGAGAGQARRADAYNGTTKRLTVATAWAVNPDGTTTFEVRPWASVRVSDIDPTPEASLVDAIFAKAVEGTRTFMGATRVMLSAMAGKASGLNTGNPQYRDTTDTKTRINANTDAFGNRSSVTLDDS